jgi:hypothetical protein
MIKERPAAATADDRITVVLDWFAELERLAPLTR